MVQTVGLDGAESALSDANSAPTISAISDLSIPSGGSTGALAFTIGDAETSAASLTLTRNSSNTSLVPIANVTLGGSGASRSVTVTPISGLTGTSTITVTVGDGLLSTNETFLLTVTANYLSWATSQGIAGASPTGDNDYDGLTNLMEYALGTNVQVADPSVGALIGNVITYTKGTAAIANGDITWIIETSETLAPNSWTPQVTHTPGNASPTISYTLTPGSQGRIFVRLRVTQTP